MKRVIPAALKVLFLSSLLLLSHSTVFAKYQDTIILNPGEKVQRQFYIQDVVDPQALKPVETFVVVTTGPAETLSIELNSDADLDFTERIDLSLMGTAFSQTAGFIPIFESGETPYGAEAQILIDADFGFAVVGAMVTGYIGDIDIPIASTIVFSLSAPHEEENDHEDNDGHDEDDHEDDDDHDH